MGVVSKILAAHFKTYLSAMEKMQSDVAGQADVLGAPEGGGASGAVLGLFGKSSSRATTVSAPRRAHTDVCPWILCVAAAATLLAFATPLLYATTKQNLQPPCPACP